jgi:ligand-binding sensor domain-containing protein/signal transduction histidine kinase
MRVMSSADARKGVVWRGSVVTCVLLVCSSPAVALNPALDVSQYAHTSWRIRDGFAKGAIRSVVQTPDGYLWLGTEFGLLRFDGVRTVQWQSLSGQQLPSDVITKLLAARDGSLWIATSKGLANWKAGKLTQYLAGKYVIPLLEDREGTVWAGTALGDGRLCAVHKGSVQCFGDDGRFGGGVYGLYEDRKGSLLVGVPNGLWRWKPGSPEFHPLPGEVDGIQGFTETDDGALVIGTRTGIRRLVDGTESPAQLPAVPAIRATSLLRDRDSGLWIATSDGLVHAHEGRTDVFESSAGLSGDSVRSLLEDREGNIWVATNGGLDRFREFAVTTFSRNQGISNAQGGSVLVDKEGSVWVGTFNGLRKWSRGQTTTYLESARSQRTGSSATRAIVTSKTSESSVGSLFQDDRGRIWLTTLKGIGYLENRRLVSVTRVPPGNVRSIGEDAAGNLWIANQGVGLVRLSPRGEVQRMPLATPGHDKRVSALAADSRTDGLWLGFFQGGVEYVADGQTRASYSADNGLGAGQVNDLKPNPDGTLWVATDGGLSLLKGGSAATLSTRNGLPCDAVHWVLEDSAHSLWLGTPCGLVRVLRAEIEAWVAGHGVNSAHRIISATVFDSSDGVISMPTVGYMPRAGKSPQDGRMWFSTVDGISVVDPSHLPFNGVPPPVHIEQTTADRTTYDITYSTNTRVRLPPLTRDLQIDYTALSLVVPEKNRFKYKLEGFDRVWQDVGTRRQAFYNNLPPRNYRFRVIASNDSGVWNEAGASLDFAIAPAYYQTRWFEALVAGAGLTLLWAAYRFRVRRIAHEFDLRLNERVNERTRVARELHDTLLQTFHGVLFRFQAAVNMLQERPAEAKQKLDSAIDRAAQAITEGRDAIQDLRASTVVTNDLAVAISTLGNELAASGVNGHGTVVHVAVQGTPRDLHPILRDDIYRIAGEALRNSFRHAHARLIEVEITYDDRQFRLQVRDDGKGMDASVRADDRRGHFGLPGMRERAELVGGRLDVWSEVGAGTEIDLTIPASMAYAKSRAAGWARFWGPRKLNE